MSMLLLYYPMIPHQISTSRWCFFPHRRSRGAAVAQVEGGTPRPGHAVAGPRLMRSQGFVALAALGIFTSTYFNMYNIYIFTIYIYSYVTHTRSYGYILKYVYIYTVHMYRIVKITYISNIGSSGASPLTMAPMSIRIRNASEDAGQREAKVQFMWGLQQWP